MADISKLDDISKLQTYEDYIANNIAEWEAESIARVCRKIGKIGRMSKKELEKFDADKEAKKEWEKIIAALAIATALNIRTLKKAYVSEFEAWEKQNEYLYQYRGKKPLGVKNGALQGIIDKAVKQNGKDVLNLTNTKALSVLDRNGNPIRFQDAIYKSFSDAVKTVTEGKADFYSTMRQTAQNLGGGGCRVNYGDGITRRLDTVVRQNMAYGIKQSHKEYNEVVGREIGADGIEIDYHSNSRPSHRYMQGKQYAKGAEGKTVNGVFYPSAEKEGVYDRLYEDYNCRHYETDIILGVSEPRYSAEELRRFEERDKRLYKIGNIEKDGYGWSQSMRAIETDIRKSKDEINALKSFGNSEPRIKELQNRIKTFQAKYDEISDVTGIAKEKRRLTVVDGSKHKISSDVIKIKSRDGSAPINESFAKEMLQETNKFEGKFGAVEGLKGINSKRYENDGVWGEYSDITGQINLYGIGGKEGRVNISNIAKKMYKDGKWSTNSPFHTLRHELSHCWLQSQKSFEGFNVKLQEIEKIKNNILSGLTGSEESDKIIMKNKLSIYGLEPNGEIDDFICECMAEYMTKNPREISKQIVKILLGE